MKNDFFLDKSTSTLLKEYTRLFNNICKGKDEHTRQVNLIQILEIEHELAKREEGYNG